MAKGFGKTNKKESKISNPYSVQGLNKVDYKAGWLSKIHIPLDFDTCFNILILVEILLGQLILCNGLTTTQAMQSEIHRTIMIIINSNEIRTYLMAFVALDTNQYSRLYKDEDYIERFNIY